MKLILLYFYYREFNYLAAKKCSEITKINVQIIILHITNKQALEYVS